LAEESYRRWRPLEGSFFAAVCTGMASIRTSAVLVRKSLLDTVGGFDEQMVSGEDYDLWMRLALDNKVALLDMPVLRKRQHDDNFSKNWEAAYTSCYSSLRKIQRIAGPRWQWLLAAERSRTATRHARVLVNYRRYGDALQVLKRSCSYSWTRPAWWWSVVKLVGRIALLRS
jgi:GT2 family glycosyltransferase